MDEHSNQEIFTHLIRETNRMLFSWDVAEASFSYLSKGFRLYIEQALGSNAVSNPAMLFGAIHADDKPYLLSEYEELLKGTFKENVEFRIILPDLSERWLQARPELVTTGAGAKFVAGYLEDITNQKTNFSNLEKFATKKNFILEILSHDLAGPLANIHAMAEVLYTNTEDYQNAEVTQIVSLIRESCARSIRMIRDLVQQEFLEATHAGLIKKRVNLYQKLMWAIEQYKQGENHIQKDIRFTASSDTIYANIDENKFMQVINNLFSNAIKFTHDDGIIAIDLQEQEDAVLITMKDNGIGIPEKYHQELFDKFTPARREGLRGEPSTGLGMSLIKTIVEWHDARIWFESEVNGGTTFYIALPKQE
ncbi:PAS domain-containing sensor histidine kinase [Pontibacter liquoris]|uniref:PAS domain-containing sensor histidine kinase n=1 Tax=Pontibacter liquoris TaxID=2905677 RepID=UPI001FA6B7BB|nr:PAS domain-containing sensor histidine kinase [Pontibacter liquoris]